MQSTTNDLILILEKLQRIERMLKRIVTDSIQSYQQAKVKLLGYANFGE